MEGDKGEGRESDSAEEGATRVVVMMADVPEATVYTQHTTAVSVLQLTRPDTAA